jgi:hypothetical protein
VWTIIFFCTPPKQVIFGQDPIGATIGRNGKRITNTEGLSQGFVYYIFQDSYGFIWVSTKDGLNRYDGYGFKTFRNNPEKPESIGSNESLNLLEDSQQNLWINTINKGVDLYIRELDVFLHFKTSSAEPLRLSHDQIYWMALRNDHEIWICTEVGIDVITFDTKRTAPLNESKKSSLEKALSRLQFTVDHYPFKPNQDLRRLYPRLLQNGSMVGLHDNYPHELTFSSGFEIRPLAIPTLPYTRGSNETIHTMVSDAKHNMLYLFFEKQCSCGTCLHKR